MSLFEYLSIAFSLVFSFAAVRLLGGLPHAMAQNRWYWVHLAAILLLLVRVMGVFWALWSYQEVIWSFPKFMLVMTIPGTLYFMCVTMVPENPGNIMSWYDYYYSVRVRYYAGMCLFALAIVVSTTVLLNMPWDHPARIAHLLFFIIGVVGVSTANPRVHEGIAIVLLVAMIFLAVNIIFQPGSLSQFPG